MQAVADPDALPDDDDARGRYQRMLAMDATIYGLPSVFQYAQLYEQAVDVSTTSYTGFNRFLHQRERNPRLRRLQDAQRRYPLLQCVGSTSPADQRSSRCRRSRVRYYTLQVVDMYGNSTNLSSRTVGPGGGRFLVATTTWTATCPPTPLCFASPRRTC